MEDQPQQVPIFITWGDAEQLPVMACNVFAVLQTPHEFILTFGFTTPPFFAKQPTPEEVARIKTLPAKSIARISMPPGRVVELLQLLQQHLNAYQQQQKH